MYIVKATKKVRGSNEYVDCEYSGIKHLFYKDAVKEKNEALKLNPYYIGEFHIEEV